MPIYNYLSQYLEKYQFTLSVISEGVPDDNPHAIRVRHKEIQLCFSTLRVLFTSERPDAVIFWVGPHLYMFPVLFLAKLLKIKVIHWGHRRPTRPYTLIKNFIYNCEHYIDDAVILYAENLRNYVYNRFRSKIFIANNTLNLLTHDPSRVIKEDVQAKYGIHTSKNIICMGRMQRRKRIDDLIQAFHMLNKEDVGLILSGPDSDGVLKNIKGKNIFKIGPVYGEESYNLLSMSDVYCLPGAIGLSIVDAFYCGLPVITENIIHGPEIMYLKDGINGFIVPKGDIPQLTAKLEILLTDDALRKRFSEAAKKEIMTSGHIDRMCEGFRNALQYVCN